MSIIKNIGLLAASLLTTPILIAAPSAEDFKQALTAAPKGHADLQSEARSEAYQKIFFQVSIDFPILSDWVLQDGGKDAWKIVLPEKRDA